MATTKPAKRGFLERSRAVRAPVADIVTETRAELCRPDLRLNSPPAATKMPILPTDFETGQVLEDYTEAYFNEHYEGDHLVSGQKSQLVSDRDARSDRFQSHVNPAFQHDSEPRRGNQGGSSEAAEPLNVDKTKISQTEKEKGGDAKSKAHPRSKPYHAPSEVTKATHTDRSTAREDSNRDTSAPKLDKTDPPAKTYNRQQVEVKSADSGVEKLDVRVTTRDGANDEITDVFVGDKTDADSSIVQTAPSGNKEVSSSTEQRQCLDGVLVVAVNQKQSGGRGKPERPHSRSLSSVTAYISNNMSDSGSSIVQRSRSMRLQLASDSEIPRVRKPLLRELSFSDSDSKKVRNYGSLRASGGLPRRRQISLGDEDEDNKDIPKFLKSELASSLLDLMQQLMTRGKVRQVAVFEQRNACLLTSLPPWNLTNRDQAGLVKAVTSGLETMFKISVEKEFYTCFKHGKDKIVCHSGDSVLVAQTTNCCVVVGVASDHIPGSCLYEVSELARALLDKGW